MRINHARLSPCRAEIIRSLQIFPHRQLTCQRANLILAADIIITHSREGLYIKIRYGHRCTNTHRAISIGQAAGNIEHTAVILCRDVHHTGFFCLSFFLFFLFVCRKFFPCGINFLLAILFRKRSGCFYPGTVVYGHNGYAFAAHIADRTLQGLGICHRIIIASLIGVIGRRAGTTVQDIMVYIVLARQRYIIARQLCLIGYSQHAVCAAVKYIDHCTNSR